MGKVEATSVEENIDDRRAKTPHMLAEENLQVVDSQWERETCVRRY